jgi:hypothetical protein
LNASSDENSYGIPVGSKLPHVSLHHHMSPNSHNYTCLRSLSNFELVLSSPVHIGTPKVIGAEAELCRSSSLFLSLGVTSLTLLKALAAVSLRTKYFSVVPPRLGYGLLFIIKLSLSESLSPSLSPRLSLRLGCGQREMPVCVFITAGPMIKLCAGGEGDSEGHVLGPVRNPVL